MLEISELTRRVPRRPRCPNKPIRRREMERSAASFGVRFLKSAVRRRCRPKSFYERTVRRRRHSDESPRRVPVRAFSPLFYYHFITTTLRRTSPGPLCILRDDGVVLNELPEIESSKGRENFAKYFPFKL